MDRDSPILTPQQRADLAALADGSLEGGRRRQVSEWVSASPELRDLYEREREVVGRLHQARAEDRAPAGLRRRIGSSLHSQPARARPAYVLPGAVAALAVVLALALVLPGGAPGGPSVSQAAALAGRGAAAPAPARGHGPRAGALRLDVQEVYFPDWSRSLGWRAVGQRADRLGARQAATVFYRSGTRVVAYTIVAAPALREPAGAVVRYAGLRLVSLRLGSHAVVTWRRSGRTCVLSGPLGAQTLLLRLAAWQGRRG